MIKEKITRLQFDLSNDFIKILDTGKKVNGYSSRKEVLLHALSFTFYVVKMIRKGYVLKLKKGKEELVIPYI